MLAISLLLISLCSAASQEVGNLTLGVLPSPVLGVDISFNPRPTFSWQISGGAQSSYQLKLYTTPSNTLVWDSGTVSSPQTTQIVYGGSTQLSFDTDYVWAVTVTFSSSSSVTSSPAYFSTGLDSFAWGSSAQWIGGCTTGLASPQVRFSFSLTPDAITRAIAYSSGLGIYTLHINGVRVGGGVDALTPGWSTVPTVRVLAQSYNVSSLLLPGENVVGMRMGQGKYGYVHEFCAAGDATCYAALLNLRITQVGGNTTTIATTGDWTCAPSPITFNHLFDGESYNASLEQPGWDSPGFTPQNGPWIPVPLRSPNVTALSTGVPPIQTQANITPVSLTPSAGGGTPVVSGGQFIISSPNPNVYWWANGTTVKNFVTECQPCPSVSACGDLHQVPAAVMNSLSDGGNFSCSMLPKSNTTSWVFDLGRNMAGVCSLTLPVSTPPPASGTTLTLVHGEILESAGGAVKNTYGTSGTQRGCSVNSINCADQMDSYTFGSGPPSSPVFTPSFTFHGMRYVGLFGWPASAPPPTIASLTCHRQYSAMDDAGGVNFPSSPILNAIQAAVVATQKSNFFSIASDCPTREKRGWMGDASVSVDQAMLNLRATALYENWVRTFGEIASLGCNGPSSSPSLAFDAHLSSPQRPSEYLCCGTRGEFGCQPGKTPVNATASLPDVVPFDSISGWPGDFIWQSAGVGIPAALLQAEGNVPFLTLVWPYIFNLMEATVRDLEGGLLMWGPYGDWVAGEGVSTLFAENAYLYRALLQCATMATALGHLDEATTFTALAGAVNSAMVGALWNPVSGVWDGGVGNQNAQAMALALALGGSATANATQAIEAAMEKDAQGHGFHPTGGLASVRFIFQGLHFANASMALQVATNPTPPGFGYMVSTPDMPGTIWEEWGGDAYDSQGSKDHPMFSGGIGVWLYEGAVGLSFKHTPSLSLDPTATTPASPCPLFGVSTPGLPPQYQTIACTVAQEVTQSLTTSGGSSSSISRIQLRSMLSRVNELISATDTTLVRRGPPPPLTPTFTAAPAADIVRALLTASGHHDSPQGRSSLSWTLASPSPLQFSLTTTLAWGVQGRVALPLGLLSEGVLGGGGVYRIVCTKGGGGVVVGEWLLAASPSPAEGVTLTPMHNSSPSTIVGVVASEAEVEGLGRLWMKHTAPLRGAALFTLVEGGEYQFTLSE